MTPDRSSQARPFQSSAPDDLIAGWGGAVRDTGQILCEPLRIGGIRGGRSASLHRRWNHHPGCSV